MRYLKALAAAIVLFGLTIGVPIGLVLGYGNPIKGFTQGLVTDTTILDVLVLLCWFLWVQMTLCFAVEAVNQVRHARGSSAVVTVPAVGLQADLARVLVGAILALGVVGTSVSIGGRADALTNMAANMRTHAEAAAVAIAPHAPPTDVAASGSVMEVTVEPGDSLWKLAEIHLGDGAAWRTIANLNRGRSVGDGVIATSAVLQSGLQPGWRILVPVDPGERQHVVQPGENLSEIAEDATGAASNWPKVYAANRETIGADPNLIQPGENLSIAVGPPAESTRPHSDAATPQDREVDPLESPPIAPPLTAPLNGREAAAHGSSDQQASADEITAAAPWLVGSLLLTGGVLAGNLYLRLRERRRDRFRARRPGRTITGPDPTVLPLAKTVAFVGAPIAETVTVLDLQLRELGRIQSQAGHPLPALAAIELTATHVLLHLTEPATLAEPWEGLDSEALRWRTPIAGAVTDEEAWDWPAPYPLLATFGHDENDHWWLLNLEQLGVLDITGDHDRAENLLRYIAAELAVANWARDARIELIGLGAELAGIDSRLRVHIPEAAEDCASKGIDHAQVMIQRTTAVATDTATARAGQPDDEVWDAHLIILAARARESEGAGELGDLIGSRRGRTATALVKTAAATNSEGNTGVALSIGTDGQVAVDAIGLRLTATQLPADDAAAITSLYCEARDLTDAPVPADENALPGSPLAHTDVAGNLRPEHVVDRGARTLGSDSVTLLEASDEVYLDTGAAVEEDLQVLAPKVPLTVATILKGSDPHLNEDLAEWRDHHDRRPRLRLLGAVKAFAYGPNLGEIGQRTGFYTELLAFLWAHSNQGATMNDLLEAFPTLSPPRVRADVATLREWLGNNPKTSQPLLPPATQAPARAHHGRNVYQIDCGPGGLLTDVDLLRRLRVAGQACGGQAGVARTARALTELVDGQPFTGLRDNGWSWLLEGDRIDEQMVVAIVDMAHIATTHYLAVGDIDSARATADIGLLAAPYEETPRLDMVAVKDADGAATEAATLLDVGVLNRSDDGRAPLDPSERTRRIVKQRGWTQTV